MPNGARLTWPPSATKTTTTPTTAMPTAAIKRCAAPSASPRFQASKGPNGITSSSGTNSGPKVRSKNGAPTEMRSPVSASSASG